MNKFKLMLALLAAPSMVLASCNNNQQETEDDKKVTKVSVSCSETEVMVGKSIKATANVTALNGASKSVTWSSSDKTVATVDSSGKITGKKVGTATITATSKFDTSKSGNIVIEVIPAYWTQEQLDMFDEVLPEPLPYIEGNWEIDDSYAEYGYIMVCSEDAKALDNAKAAFEADDDYNYLGTNYDEEYDCDDFYYAKPSIDYLGYETFVDMYSLGGGTCVQACFTYTEYEEWPAAEIASYMNLLEFEGVVPSFVNDDAYFTAAPEELEGGGSCIYITAGSEDSYLYASDYIASVDDSAYYIVDYGGYFIVSPLDKAFSIVVMDPEDEEYYGYGFELMVLDYIPDEWIQFEDALIIAPVDEGDVELFWEKGIDVADGLALSFTSSKTDVATVTDAGILTPVAAGETVVTINYGDYTDQMTVLVFDTMPTEFSDEQKTVFKNIYDSEDLLPVFNPYFTSVSYNSEYDCVEVLAHEGYEISFDEFKQYYDDMIAAGWEDYYEASGYYEYYLALYQAFGIDITLEELKLSFLEEGIAYFEKQINIGGVDYFVSADAYINDNYLFEVDVYDCYFYDAAEVNAEVNSYFEDLFGLEEAEALPEIEASHYYVSGNEADEEYDEEAYVEVDAFDVTSTIDDVKTAFEAQGFDVEKVDVPEDVEYEIEAYSYLTGLSEDELIYFEAQIEDGDLVIYYYSASSASEGVAFDFVNEFNTTSATVGDFSLTTAKAGGQTAPAYNSDKAELRVYANNTLTITSSGDNVTSVFIEANNCNCSKATGSFVKASSGTISAVDGGYYWEGDASSVTFTVSSSGQVHITYVEVNGGGSGGGGGGSSEAPEIDANILNAAKSVYANVFGSQPGSIGNYDDEESEADMYTCKNGTLEFAGFFAYEEVEDDSIYAEIYNSLVDALPSGATKYTGYEGEIDEDYGFYDVWYIKDGFIYAIYVADYYGYFVTYSVDVFEEEEADNYQSYVYSEEVDE